MNNTHSMLVGYLLWIFGFTGAHRFYYGKPVSGTIWFFTLGLLGIGWLIDVFLIPGMDAEADSRYKAGPLDYTIAWLLLTFLGVFGLHRLYMGKWVSGLIWLLVGISCTTVFWFIPFVLLLLPVIALMWVYDFWTLNDQIDAINRGI